MAGTLPAMPLNSPVVDLPVNPKDKDSGWTLTRSWVQWFNAIASAVQSTSPLLRATSLSGQGASITATPVPIGSIAAGVFRVAWHARITQAATTSSSLTVSIGYTTSGIPCTQSGAAITGNTTATVQSWTVLITADQATPITYATTYATVGATPMQYALTVTVERVT